MTSASSSTGAAAAHAPHLHISTNPTTALPSSSYCNKLSSGKASGSHSPRGTGSSGSGGSGSANQACAACKYQRRKCNSDCPLAPYFPADQQRRFLNAHRLFGVSNILKTLRGLRPDLCAEAMNTLIFQAEMRVQDPVGGCYRLILGLERQIEIERAELAAVHHHLALCRQAAAMPPKPGDFDVTSSNQAPLLLNADQDVVVDALYSNHHHEVLQKTEGHPHEDHQGHSPQQHGELFDYFYYDTTAAVDDGSSKPAALAINVDAMSEFGYGEDQKLDINVHDELATGQQQQQLLDVNCHLDHNDYEVKAAPLLVDVFDMRQQGVDVNADDIDVKAVVDVNADINIDIDINAVGANAEVDLNEELQENDTNNNIATCEAVQCSVEPSQCKPEGLAFSAL